MRELASPLWQRLQFVFINVVLWHLLSWAWNGLLSVCVRHARLLGCSNIQRTSPEEGWETIIPRWPWGGDSIRQGKLWNWIMRFAVKTLCAWLGWGGDDNYVYWFSIAVDVFNSLEVQSESDMMQRRRILPALVIVAVLLLIHSRTFPQGQITPPKKLFWLFATSENTFILFIVLVKLISSSFFPLQKPSKALGIHCSSENTNYIFIFL